MLFIVDADISSICFTTVEHIGSVLEPFSAYYGNQTLADAEVLLRGAWCRSTGVAIHWKR